MIALEATVSQLVQNHHVSSTLHVFQPGIAPHQNIQSRIAGSAATPAAISSTTLSLSSKVRQLGKLEFESIASIYTRFYACQPLQLLLATNLDELLPRMDDSVLFALVALCLRYDQRIGPLTYSDDSQALRDAANLQIMNDVASRAVRVSTVQAVCLLILYDLNGMSALS